ncbi:Plasma membrane t-SNARE, secretory vesicle fusion [Arthrobotrys musiformis]|uniref:Plasma membrane t-SNARE, secretory vesicle fusion n=1 Tax=Arthrobotrys musiformis TaxID=47236 RepID=A0AAV9VTR5_9PEZI
MNPIQTLDLGGISATQAFLNDVARLREENKAIEAKIQAISNLQVESLSKLTYGDPQLCANMAELSIANAKMVESIRSLFLKAKGSENIAHATVIQKGFEETMRQYQKAQVEHMKQMREQLARQYRIVNPNATQEDIERVQEKGDQPIFSTTVGCSIPFAPKLEPSFPLGQQADFKEYLQTLEARIGQGSSDLKDVHSHYINIQKIEQSMEELAELFKQLNELIYAQDISIGEGEDRVQEVAADVEAGANKLGTAFNHAEKTRKNKRWLLIIALIITLIIFFAAIFTIKPWE